MALTPMALPRSSHAVVIGSGALTEGLNPRQALVQVSVRVAGKALGMRVTSVQYAFLPCGVPAGQHRFNASA